MEIPEAYKVAALVLVVLLSIFYGILPPKGPEKAELKLDAVSYSPENSTLRFSLSYTAPVPKVCYVVVYGPFAGNEGEGNQIYTLRSTQGKIEEKLHLLGKLNKFRAELWCEHRKLAEVERELS